ncbi:MAG: hypothetical protein ABFC34_07345, partial [Methanobacterium sp.]
NTNNATMGGALFNNLTTTITNTQFNTNNATWGGAIYNNNTLTVGTGPCTFNSNNAEDKGGAIYNNGTRDVDVTTIFIGNTAPYGPNIYDVP